MEEFTQLLISIFQGFSRCIGKIQLMDKLHEIASTAHERNVGKIRVLLRQGKDDEAAQVKKQLPGFTLSATYGSRRVAECIETYTDMLMLDFDKMDSEALRRNLALIAQDENTLFCFLSPSGNGIKIGAYMLDESSQRLRGELLQRTEIAYEELEHYHKQMFGYAKAYYEQLTGCEMDDSGSDIGRLCFSSYDPDICIRPQALARVRLPQLTILPPAPVAKKKTARQLLKEELPGREEVDCSHIEVSLQMEFQNCARIVQQKDTYVSGNRDNFIFALGNKCYQRDLPEAAVVALTEKQFGAPDLDVAQIIANAYRYTSRIDAQQEEKKKTTAQRITEYADQHYEIRRNVVQERLEFRTKSAPAGAPLPFTPMKRQHYNTVFYDLQMAGIACQLNTVKSLIDSRYAKDYNPFAEYFYGLKVWDEKTDYIAQLAATVTTTDQPFWEDCLRRWLVGMVACALDDEVTNQLALIMKGAQGKGKSTWIRHLLPPSLHKYYRNGMLNPENKDHMLFLSQCLLINLEEFEGMKSGSIAELKRIIGQDWITERRAYELDADQYVRRASFIASTNEPRFHKDTGGNRRFPTVTALEIDYHTPVNHDGVFAQALYLWKHDFHYWYEKEEIDELNLKNREYTLAGIEEELLYVCCRKPLPEDLSLRWMPAAAILALISSNSRIQVNDRSVRNLVQILERDGFAKRLSPNNIWEYEVVIFSYEEIDQNYKQREQKKREEEGTGQALPF